MVQLTPSCLLKSDRRHEESFRGNQYVRKSLHDLAVGASPLLVIISLIVPTVTLSHEVSGDVGYEAIG